MFTVTKSELQFDLNVLVDLDTVTNSIIVSLGDASVQSAVPPKLIHPALYLANTGGVLLAKLIIENRGKKAKEKKKRIQPSH